MVGLKAHFSRQGWCFNVAPNLKGRNGMKKFIQHLAASCIALFLTTGLAAAQSKVTIAVGGSACLCYLPTILAQQLGEYEKAGVKVELVDSKGGSQSLAAVLGGSA